MAKKKNPNSNPKSGGIGFIVTALVLSSLTGFSLGGILIGVAVGLGIGKITSIMGSGLDTTTHNKEDIAKQRQAEEAERQRQKAEAEQKAKAEASRIPLTGDAAADAVITRGQDMINTIRKENAAIPDPVLSAQMESVCEKCEQIFRSVSEAPSKAPQVRKFMNYYLPTTLKMLANYRTMQNRGVSVQEMRTARETTVRGMNMILTACQKQIDNLHKENLMDISTDIDTDDILCRFISRYIGDVWFGAYIYIRITIHDSCVASTEDSSNSSNLASGMIRQRHGSAVGKCPRRTCVNCSGCHTCVLSHYLIDVHGRIARHDSSFSKSSTEYPADAGERFDVNSWVGLSARRGISSSITTTVELADGDRITAGFLDVHSDGTFDGAA